MSFTLKGQRRSSGHQKNKTWSRPHSRKTTGPNIGDMLAWSRLETYHDHKWHL
jgi:hypothetical protein